MTLFHTGTLQGRSVLSYTFNLDYQRLSLRLMSVWLLALAAYWFGVLVFLSPAIRFAFFNGFLLESYNVRSFGEPTIFFILALLTGVGALLGKQWFRYFLYALTFLVVVSWLWHTLPTATMLWGYPSLSKKALIVYNFVFTEAGPALALTGLSLIAIRMATQFRWRSDNPQLASNGNGVLPLSLWMLLGGILLLVWFPHAQKNLTLIVISLPGIRGHDDLLLLLYIIAVVTYPIIYLAAVLLARRVVKGSQDQRTALLFLNLPLVNIVVGSAAWFKVLALSTSFR